jgi:predicted kinase
MKTLYFTCGVSFSGKSTLAKRIAEHKKAFLISQDALWFEKEKEWNLQEDSDEDWSRIYKIAKERIGAELSKGHSVVFDDLSLKYADRESLRNIAKEHAARAVLIYLDTPTAVREERRTKNMQTSERHQVKQEIVDWANKEMEIPSAQEHAIVFTPEMELGSWLRELP